MGVSSTERPHRAALGQQAMPKRFAVTTGLHGSLRGSQTTLRHTPSLAPARAAACVPKMVARVNYLGAVADTTSCVRGSLDRFKSGPKAVHKTVQCVSG